MGRRVSLAGGIAFAAWPATAFGCTLCHSPQALSLRERLFDGDLLWNAAAILLPVLLLLLIVALVAYEPRARDAP